MNRIFVMTGALLISAESMAQSVLKSTKGDISTGVASSTGPSPWALFQLILALGIVAALLKFVLPRFFPSLKNRVQTSLGSTIKIEETATFPGGNLLVVKVRDKSVLIGATPQSISFLADLTPTSEEPKAFFEMVDAAPGKKAPAFAVIPDEAQIPVTPPATIRRKVAEVKEKATTDPGLNQSVDHDELLRRLARLEKLTR